ncbi:hypothetical protein GCM10007962_09510 [Yeosuana aromativorans]|uniref:Exostosin GT47 domain-containing protein n=1 Tax=Yeosuana aromativorans TaxID=288019 RepID=A0A8J3BKI7_9FLAO|nr:hypothetical protein GCM10007962_09510 [Yeosuana aromativorans]
MLNLFTDKTFLTEKYRRDVFPLLFDLYFLNSEILADHYLLVDDVLKSDFIILPIDYAKFLKFKLALKKLQKLSKIHNKPIWIYTAGDYGFTNYIRNSYTFRLGGFKSKHTQNTFILPSFINDPYLDYLKSGFSTVKKGNAPTIGFVGHAQDGLKKYISESINHLKYKFKKAFGLIIADFQSFYPSSIKRKKYLSVLQKSRLLKTNFILRNNYRDGVKNDIERHQSTKEFYNNMFKNAYTFCSRGVGNFSVRFYETLAVGRIPILLDTDCRLPLEGLIDWSEHCVILVESSNVSFEQQILNFHNSKSEESFEAIQKANRMLWETHLRRDMFFLKIHDLFINKKMNHA